MALFWIFSPKFSGYFRFPLAFVIGDMFVFLRFIVVMVIADCSTGSRVNFSEGISSGTALTKEKDLSLSRELFSCRQRKWLQPVVMREITSVVDKRETRSAWYQCIVIIQPIFGLDFIIDFSCNRNCHIIFLLEYIIFLKACFGFLDVMYHINCYVIVFENNIE